MSENFFQKFSNNHDQAFGFSDERHEPNLREFEKRKRTEAGKCGGKIDVRSFLPRAGANTSTPIAAVSHVVKSEHDKENQHPNFDVSDLQMGAERWTPADDLLLTMSVLQVMDLEIVYALCKFSCKFTLLEVQTRWNALLYNEYVIKLSAAGIRKLHPEQVAAIHALAPFSLAEEQLLAEICSSSQPSLADLQLLLETNSSTFYHSRTPKCLLKHWHLMKQYELLCDQQAKPKKLAGNLSPPPSFADVDEELLTHKETTANGSDDAVLDSHVNQELQFWDQQMKHKIRLLEDENDHWLQLVNVLGVDLSLKPQFGNKVFALLRGRNLRYEMFKRSFTFGRQCAEGEVLDLDLSVEGPASKISRFQGVIELGDDGLFLISNFGKYPFFVNGKSILVNRKRELTDNAVIELFNITLIFQIHKDLVERICYGNEVCN